jgi:hypothetical protein
MQLIIFGELKNMCLFDEPAGYWPNISQKTNMVTLKSECIVSRVSTRHCPGCSFCAARTLINPVCVCDEFSPHTAAVEFYRPRSLHKITNSVQQHRVGIYWNAHGKTSCKANMANGQPPAICHIWGLSDQSFLFSIILDHFHIWFNFLKWDPNFISEDDQ